MSSNTIFVIPESYKKTVVITKDAAKNTKSDVSKYILEITQDGIGKWVAGSTLCLNLGDRNKIPAFYNPPLARGEDTFFSTLLGNSKIVRIPVYHFHDGFLKYTEIMEGIYPKSLRKIKLPKENFCVAKHKLKAHL